MKSSIPLRSLAFIIGLSVLSLVVHAQVPQLINYQGRVAVSGTNFNGVGQFGFALVDGSGATTYWSNDNTSTGGGKPAAAVSLTVSKGLYSVLLGDAALPNMTAVPATVFSHSDVRLRVWFNDGSHGWQQLTPDQRIAAVGYAMMSVTSGSAILAGTALTSGSAAVSGSTMQAGTALISGSATVSGSAAQAGTSLTSGSAAVSGSASALIGDVPIFVMSHFMPNGTSRQSGNNDQALYISTSVDLFNWHTINGGNPVHYAPGPNSGTFFNVLRDPHIILRPDGWYYVAYTMGTYGNCSTLGLCRSKDLINWQDMLPVNASIFPVVGGTSQLTWNPGWVTYGGTTYLTFAADPNAGNVYQPSVMQCYYITPTNADWTAWTTPVSMHLQGTSNNEANIFVSGSLMICGHIDYHGGWGGGANIVSTGTSLSGPWTVKTSWNGEEYGGVFDEGVQILQRPSSNDFLIMAESGSGYHIHTMSSTYAVSKQFTVVQDDYGIQMKNGGVIQVVNSGNLFPPAIAGIQGMSMQSPDNVQITGGSITGISVANTILSGTTANTGLISGGTFSGTIAGGILNSPTLSGTTVNNGLISGGTFTGTTNLEAWCASSALRLINTSTVSVVQTNGPGSSVTSGAGLLQITISSTNSAYYAASELLHTVYNEDSTGAGFNWSTHLYRVGVNLAAQTGASVKTFVQTEPANGAVSTAPLTGSQKGIGFVCYNGTVQLYAANGTTLTAGTAIVFNQYGGGYILENDHGTANLYTVTPGQREVLVSTLPNACAVSGGDGGVSWGMIVANVGNGGNASFLLGGYQKVTP